MVDTHTRHGVRADHIGNRTGHGVRADYIGNRTRPGHHRTHQRACARAAVLGDR